MKNNNQDPADKRQALWLKVRYRKQEGSYQKIDRYHNENGLHSVCHSAGCPNQRECWSRGTATFMLLGDQCTRHCAFCGVSSGQPLPANTDEAGKIATAVAELGLCHVVITSVTRDDLPDYGSSAFVAVIECLRHVSPDCRIELLVPDLYGDWDALAEIVSAGPDVLGHNLETVPRLYSFVRHGANYKRSVKLIADAKRLAPYDLSSPD